MSVDRSTRTMLAILFLLAALFVAMNRVVESAPIGDWWLPILLFVIGVGLALAMRYDFRTRPPVEADEELEPALPAGTPAGGDVHSYRVTATSAPYAQTMTIRPEPDAPEQRAVTVTEELTGVLPFVGTSTAVLDEAVLDEAPLAEVAETTEGPSQTIPVAKDEDTGEPAPDVKFTARTESAEADEDTAKKEAPATPPTDESATETKRTTPGKQVVEDTMSAPEQPYETEQVGEITPERAERVVEDSGEQDEPVVSETASPRVAAEARGEGTSGKPDDLRKIRGIGKKSADALKSAGIDSFQKLANSTSEQINTALEAGGVRLVGNIDTWTQQAAYAARGDWEGLDRFNAEQNAASGD